MSLTRTLTGLGGHPQFRMISSLYLFTSTKTLCADKVTWWPGGRDFLEDAIQPSMVANDKNLVDFTKYRDFCLLLNSQQALVGLQWAGVEGQLALCRLVFSGTWCSTQLFICLGRVWVQVGQSPGLCGAEIFFLLSHLPPNDSLAKGTHLFNAWLNHIYFQSQKYLIPISNPKLKPMQHGKCRSGRDWELCDIGQGGRGWLPGQASLAAPALILCGPGWVTQSWLPSVSHLWNGYNNSSFQCCENLKYCV